MNTGWFAARAIVLTALMTVGSYASAAERVQEFTYDDAGRLRKLISPERELSYTLDDAGNRISLDSTQGRGWPSWIEVPSLSISGDYTIRWGTSTGSGTRFELFEADNPGFANAAKICDDCGQERAITGRADGTYYYRVRVCDGPQSCGPRRAGANPVVVDRPPVPGVPATLSVPMSDSDGSYLLYWAASSGTVTAYDVYESVNGGAFGTMPVYTGLGDGVEFGFITLTLSGRGNGTYSYRVRACNTQYSCSAYRDGSHSLLVTLPPSTPGAVSVPAYSNTGTYTVSWGAATGPVTRYELLESSTAAETLAYSGTNSSAPFSGRPEAIFSYRVRACNGPACSAYTSERGMAGVIYIDKIPPTPPTFVGMLGNRFTLYWNGGSQDSAGVGAGSGIDHWNIYRNGSVIGTSIMSSAGGSFDDTTQPGNVTLNYYVTSVDRAGNESGGSPTYTMYRDTIPPTTPGNLRTTSVTATSVSLAWDASTDSSGIARYEITRTPGSTVSTTGPSTSYFDQAVSSATTYTYQVVAVDGQSVRSTPASITVTTLAGAPVAPVLTAPARDGDGRYTVSWTNQDTTGSVAYYVLEESRLGGPWEAWTVSGTSYNFTGQSDGDYLYRVKACTSGGVCSGYSNTKSVLVCISGCTD